MKKTIALCLVLIGVIALTPVYADELLDEFVEDELRPEWFWSAHDDITYTSEKGFLQIVIPGGKPYDIWTTHKDGVILLRKDQGAGDWVAETEFHLTPKGRGYQVGIVVWSNQHIMYFWGLKRSIDKNDGRPTGEVMGITDYSRAKKAPNLGMEAKLRIEKIGKDLDLQYWDEEAGAFVSHQTHRFKYPVSAVGIVVRTFSPKGAEVKVLFDYFRIWRTNKPGETEQTGKDEQDEAANQERKVLEDLKAEKDNGN